jgi:hypothetical protein
MSSAKWSLKGSRSTIPKGLELMTLDRTLPNATANQRMTIEQLFGAVTSSSATSGVLALPPSVLVYTGAANATRSLPAGSSDIIGLPIRIWVNVDFVVTVSPNGADTLTPYATSTTSQDCYAGSLYTFIWTGSFWIVTS